MFGGNKNTGAFGSSDSSKPAFGASTGSTGGFSFGQPAQPQSGEASKPAFSFGGASTDKPADKPTFGAAFGASADKPADAKPAFGQPASGGLFGAKSDSKPATGLFGQSADKPAAAPAFGAAASNTDKPAFGSGSGSLFGSDKPSGGLFGAKSSSEPAKDAAKPTFGGLGGASTFGSASSDKKETPLFGAPAEKKETPLFGSSQEKKAPLFGASTEKKETPLFGAATEKKETPLFGAATEKKETPLFGASTEKKETPLFGAATEKKETPLFGAATEKKETPLFGAATEKKETPLFGAAPAEKKAAPLFGAASTEKKDTPTFGASAEKKETPLFGAATTEKKDDKPAVSFGAAASTEKKDDKPAVSFGAASTEKKQEITPSMYMRNKSFEDIISKWTSALTTSQKQFQDQAQDIAKWDRVLVENGTKISNTWSEVQGLELQQTRIDDLLNYIDGQQTSLEQMLDKYESNLESAPRFDHLQPADQERKEAYGLAESLETRLDDFESSLTSLIGEINKISQNANQIKDEDPIGPVLRILNSHLASMEWIEDNAGQLQDKLQQVYARNAKTHIPSAWN